jgi:hypothetical protein
MYISASLIGIFLLLFAAIGSYAWKKYWQEREEISNKESEALAKREKELEPDNIWKRFWAIADRLTLETNYEKRQEETGDIEQAAEDSMFEDDVIEAMEANISNAEIILKGIDEFFAEIPAVYELQGEKWASVHDSLTPYKLYLRDVLANHEAVVMTKMERFFDTPGRDFKPRSQVCVEDVSKKLWECFESAAREISDAVHKHGVVKIDKPMIS